MNTFKTALWVRSLHQGEHGWVRLSLDKTEAMMVDWVKKPEDMAKIRLAPLTELLWGSFLRQVCNLGDFLDSQALTDAQITAVTGTDFLHLHVARKLLQSVFFQSQTSLMSPHHCHLCTEQLQCPLRRSMP